MRHISKLNLSNKPIDLTARANLPPVKVIHAQLRRGRKQRVVFRKSKFGVSL